MKMKRIEFEIKNCRVAMWADGDEASSVQSVSLNMLTR